MWLRGHGALVAIGVESTGSFGATLTRFLTAQAAKVVEVNRPNRLARRMDGKSDRLDAEQIARAVLHDIADPAGKLTLRRAGRLHHISIRTEHAPNPRPQARRRPPHPHHQRRYGELPRELTSTPPATTSPSADPQDHPKAKNRTPDRGPVYPGSPERSHVCPRGNTHLKHTPAPGRDHRRRPRSPPSALMPGRTTTSGPAPSAMYGRRPNSSPSCPCIGFPPFSVIRGRAMSAALAGIEGPRRDRWAVESGS